MDEDMKKRLICLLLALCLLLCPLLLTSCQGRLKKFTKYSLDYFDTATTIIGYARDQQEFDRICADILSGLEEYHRLYTIYHRYEGLENLCTINERVGGAHRTVEVDRRIIDLLIYAKQMYALTDGKINIAMGSMLSIWHDYREQGMSSPQLAALPDMQELSAAAEHTEIDKIIIDEHASTVTLADPAMTLDVGAIAKGYAVEMLAKELQEKGITGYLINVGGNVRTIGPKADGQPWTIGIENPQDDEATPHLALLALSDYSLVTSGSYQRFYMVNGQRYHHIISQETLMPARGYQSVSVVCPNSGMADALSTALFCMTLEQGQRLVESLASVEAMWVKEDGTIYESSGFSAFCTTLAS